jgi:hypothetical protein
MTSLQHRDLAPREVAANDQRISASRPSVTCSQAMIRTLDMQPSVNTD